MRPPAVTKARVPNIPGDLEKLLAKTGAYDEARAAYEIAIGLERDPAVRRFLLRRQSESSNQRIHLRMVPRSVLRLDKDGSVRGC